MNNIDKYLQRYAEPGTHLFDSPHTGSEQVVIIPVFREALDQLARVWSSLPPSMIILVVNSPGSNEVNRPLLTAIDARYETIPHSSSGAWYKADEHLLLVHEAPNLKGGVGRARKIGNDIALSLINKGAVESDLLINTDADARLPPDYVAALKATPAANSFALGRFIHEVGACVSAALYECSLLWYAAGLRYAGSDFAYPSVGSTIACRAAAYASVRGFPTREAGEDFYLLNKLRKVGDFNFVEAGPIALSSRGSERVPFGTGPGIRHIRSLAEPLNEYRFYSPRVFVQLRDFLQQLASCQGQATASHFPEPWQLEFIRSTGLNKQLQHKQHLPPQVFGKFLTDWFDGFRTLKCIHFLRDHGSPSVPYHALWNSEVLPLTCPGDSASDIQRGTEILWEQLTGQASHEKPFN